jgi:hypothetical protein
MANRVTTHHNNTGDRDVTLLQILTDTPEGYDWRDDAQCLGLDPDRMQPEVATTEDVEAAKRVCGKGTFLQCPVLRECLELALSQRAPESGQITAYGVHAGEWFGESPRLPERACDHCGELFPVQRSTARFCKAACRQAAGRAARREGLAG